MSKEIVKNRIDVSEIEVGDLLLGSKTFRLVNKEDKFINYEVKKKSGRKILEKKRFTKTSGVGGGKIEEFITY